jgi:acyl carrier protein
MNRDEIRTTALELLAEIAPELDPATLKGDQPIRDQVDLDSMDFLNYLISIHQRLEIEIPEADYGRLSTLDDLVAYVEEALAAA